MESNTSTDNGVIRNAIRLFLDGKLESTFARHPYETPNGKLGVCGVRYHIEKAVLVIFCTELPENDGISITNAAPSPWEHAEDEINVVHDRCLWIEHTAPHTLAESQGHSFELVSFEKMQVKWKHLGSFAIELAA